MPRLFDYLLIILVFVVQASAAAETVELETAEKQTAQATYLEGDNDANPVLILHGFLQTREFPTVNRLAVALNESGYTILNPSLTLGLHKRKKSLACEAIHTHNAASDAAEIAQWVDWLTKKTGKPVTLVGHSSGTQTLLKYMAGQGNTPVNRLIFISMIHFGQSEHSYETPEMAEKARADITRGNNSLDTYALSFCKTYPTHSASFLSYYEWGREAVTSHALKIRDKLSVIIGTGDKRISGKWREQLAASGLDIIEIEKANHFFDQAHEFDLLDAIEDLLQGN